MIGNYAIYKHSGRNIELLDVIRGVPRHVARKAARDRRNNKRTSGYVIMEQYVSSIEAALLVLRFNKERGIS